MTLLPDSGDPGNLLDPLKIQQIKDPDLTDQTWRHLNERFRGLRRIGRGAQAVVYEATPVDDQQNRVALKVYFAKTDADRAAFNNECRVLASGRRLPPEVVDYYYNVNNIPGVQPYLVLECIEGSKLADLAVAKRPLEFSEKLQLIERLARSFHRLHLPACNLIFGDASANNILIEKDFGVRFIDFAGAKELIRGHGPQRVSVNLRTPGFVPETEADAGALKAYRTSLSTDIYALAANAFLLLVGLPENDCRSGGSRNAESEWELALRNARVPRGIRAIILKGLRVPDDNVSNDLRLYRDAEQFANDIRNWTESRSGTVVFIKYSLVTIALLFIASAIGFVGWQRYYEAVASSDLKVWQSLQAEIRELPNLTHPAVAKLLADEKTLITQRDEADTHQDRVASRTATAALLDKSRELLTVAREIDRAEQQRIAIGKLLLEDEATKTSGFWITAAPAIQAQLTALQQRYRAIAERVRAGQTDKLATDLAQLQTDLAELFKVNIEARSAFDARAAYQRSREHVPADRLTQDGFPVVQSGAEQAEQAWTLAAWDGGQSLILARQLFGSATQQLDGWLQRNLKPEELSAIEKNSQNRVAELTAEAATLRATIVTQTTKVNELNQQIADLAKQQADLNKQLAEATTGLTTEQNLRSTANTKVQQLTQAATEQAKKLAEALVAQKTMQAALDQATPDLAKAQSDLTSTQSALALAVKDRDTFRTDAQRLKKLITDNPGVNLALSDKIAALDAQIIAIDPKDRTAAAAALVTAATQYQTLVVERADLVKPDAYEETHPKVKAKDAELALASATLTSALQKRDAADQSAFDQLQQQIDAKQKLHDDERTLGVAQLNPALVKLRDEITKLKASQSAYADGQKRAVSRSDTETPLKVDEILKLAGTSASGGRASSVSGAGTKLGDTQTITLPGGVTLKMIWIPATETPFTMGSPIGEPGRNSDEDQVAVTITKGYWIAETELTQAQWMAIQGANSKPWSEKTYVKEGPNFPASYISHGMNPDGTIEPDSATACCEKLTEIELQAGRLGTGWKYALPTEAQCEYAARAGTTGPYSFEGGEEKLGDYAWFDKNASNLEDHQYAHEVGTKLPNAWGLKDVHGNLWEWCQDGYAEKLLGGSDPVNTSAVDRRVLRGGSWSNIATDARSAIRIRFTPVFRSGIIGFRVVRTQ